MSQVGQSGGTQSTTVVSSSGADSSGVGSSTDVSPGVIGDNQNINVAQQRAQSDVLVGQEQNIPVLDEPAEVPRTAMESAHSEVGELSGITETAAANTLQLMDNMATGNLTPEEQARLEQYVQRMEGSADYLGYLSGEGLDTLDGKRSILAGMGFHSELEALLALSKKDKNALEALLVSRFGSKENVHTLKAALSDMGFSESQIEAILSMANPDDIDNVLASLHQSGSNPKNVLQALGFDASKADQLLELLKGTSPDHAEHRGLLAKMGYSEAEIDILLIGSNPAFLAQQKAVINANSPSKIAELRAATEAVNNLLNSGSPVSDEILNQMVDLFAVFELLHEMSVQSRRTARETRSIEYDAAKEQILSQAKEMEKAAHDRLIGAMTSGAAKIAAGMITIKGSMANPKTPNAGGDAAAQANARSAAVQQSMQRATAISGVVSASGEMGQAASNFEATKHDVMQKQYEAYQKTHENRAQAESEFLQLQQDMIKTIQSKMDEIIRLWFETLKSTTRG